MYASEKDACVETKHVLAGFRGLQETVDDCMGSQGRSRCPLGWRIAADRPWCLPSG